VSVSSPVTTICYWRGSADIREDLLAAVGEDGTTVLQVRRLEELLERLSSQKISLIIVDGSASSREASDRIAEITSTDVLLRYPIVFVSSQARKRCTLPNGGQSQIYPVDTPYRANYVLRGIRLLLNAGSPVAPEVFLSAITRPDSTAGLEIYQSEQALPASGEQPQQVKAGSEKEGAERTEAAHSTERISQSEAEAVRPAAVRPENKIQTPAPESQVAGKTARQLVEDNSVKNRERLRRNRDPLNLSNTTGGETFAIGSHAGDFDDELLLPSGEKREVMQKALNALTESDVWAGVHARRVAFVATALAKSLSLSRSQIDNVRVVGMFINWARTDSPSIRRYDVFQDSEKSRIRELSQAFEDSALLVEQRFGDGRAAQTMRLAAKLLLGEKTLTAAQQELLAEAECVLIVELSDRSCWGRGHWNPFGVYRIIRQLRRESGMIGSAPLKVAVIRVMGESVTAHITVGNIFIPIDDIDSESDRSARRGPRAQEADRALSSLNTVRSVSLSELLPGMRLAQPLTTLDGKTVLKADTRIDQDLLFKLWQLAAIRALPNKAEICAER
jgi:hypothetical protein